MSMFRALWQHRPFIASLVRREFQLRSVRALWGSAWLVLQPAAQILIYTVIFGRVLGAKLPGVSGQMTYGIYICAGVITWNYFSELVTRSQTLFLDHADLMKTLPFPRSALPIALVVTASLNLAIVIAIFLVALLLMDAWPGMVLLTAIPLLVVHAAIGIGLGIITGTVNVFFRDVGHVVGVVLQFWFWLTPIVYPASIAPEGLQRLFAWNPLFPLVRGYQSIAVHHTAPDWASLGPAVVFAALLLIGSWWVFRTLSPDLVDEL